MNHTMA